MNDVIIVAFSSVVVLALACLKAKWYQDGGESSLPLPKFKNPNAVRRRRQTLSRIDSNVVATHNSPYSGLHP